MKWSFFIEGISKKTFNTIASKQDITDSWIQWGKKTLLQSNNYESLTPVVKAKSDDECATQSSCDTLGPEAILGPDTFQY